MCQSVAVRSSGRIGDVCHQISTWPLWWPLHSRSNPPGRRCSLSRSLSWGCGWPGAVNATVKRRPAPIAIKSPTMVAEASRFFSQDFIALIRGDASSSTCSSVGDCGRSYQACCIAFGLKRATLVAATSKMAAARPAPTAAIAALSLPLAVRYIASLTKSSPDLSLAARAHCPNFSMTLCGTLHI